MSARRRTARASERVDLRLTRRALIRAGAGAALLVLFGWPARRSRAGSLPADLTELLERSPFVYVSPRKGDGAESRCHGEVWFGWLDGSVVVITGSERWKARALARGLDRARIWVGDHGTWKGMLGANEEFRQAPAFDARASVSKDEKLLDRLLATYERKYPEEIGHWRDKMRQGFHDGSRVLIRYTPA